MIDLCIVGASVKDLCDKGDAQILAETGKVNFKNFHLIFCKLIKFIFQTFKKEKDLKKGIAFPTCLSVNNCICHFSPTKNDPDIILKADDVVKM